MSQTLDAERAAAENTSDARAPKAPGVPGLRRLPRGARRVTVAILGAALMIAAILLGPLPGPGGIPLFLGGVALWATEFHWAHRVWGWFRRLFDRYLALPRWGRVAFWTMVIVIAWGSIYTGLVLNGVPGWAPGWVQESLGALPKVAR